MARFGALVIAMVIGAILGTVLRPSIIEIVVVAVGLMTIVALCRDSRRNARQPHAPERLQG